MARDVYWQPVMTITTRNRLICDHHEAARRIALRMARRCPAWIAREDLIAAGMVGLIEAAERYDESRGEPFLAFAEHRIRGAVMDELRRGDILPRRMRQLARKLGHAMRELEKHGEPLSEQRIAAVLGVSIEAYRSDFAALSQVEVAPLELEVVPDQHDGPDVIADRRTRAARVQQMLGRLDPRDVAVLALYYVEERTYRQIAESLGVTPSRVCQLLWRAVERLRACLDVPARGAA